MVIEADDNSFKVLECFPTSSSSSEGNWTKGFTAISSIAPSLLKITFKLNSAQKYCEKLKMKSDFKI